MPFDAHLRLVEEDAAEMVAVGEDLGLVRQVRAAAVDQIDARQPVRLGDLLRAEMLLDRHRIVSAAFDRRVVADDHRLPARHPADAGDDPRARAPRPRTCRRRRAGRSRGTASPDRAAARRVRAAASLPRDECRSRLFSVPPLRRLGDVGAQFLGKRAVVRGTRAELFAVRNDFAVDPRRAHALSFVRWSKSPAARLAAAAGVGKALRKGPPDEPHDFLDRRWRACARCLQHAAGQ